ncbi:GGDEF domain-containing protein [Pseudomonas sp. CCC3.1]|uniref:GGDEF domain-containing protein n=1 Tax=Pseudomonas sp. CCC3.1 TaxID=3048607 RepID=UPI002AC95287|nr:GGDEF domain-containing protein [Pseudomonas sp. CCC3.1]MEB0205375.1 GGDEF domain-containing protein [Pseudomonas sp. CCC3.1]WPX34665.1 GGDEF domain-containing protein [Pseudomonas sp. CCC3.1]
MLKTIETEISKHAAPPALQAEFAQHDFEKLRNFCRLTYAASIFIWLLFDLIISTKGGQGFTGLSMLFMGTMVTITLILGFIRNYRHFDVLNVIFVAVITLGIRLIIMGLPQDSQPVWLVLATASILYSASILPLSRWAFLTSAVIAGLMLNPFGLTFVSVMDLRGTMILCYYAFLSSLTIYSFFKLRRVKLYNYTMSKLLVNQAYIDALTEIPNRRSFMTRAGSVLRAQPREHDHYLAMIDIDNFKKINDRFGHDIGDEVLKRTASSIKAVMTDHEYARLGGEEFAVYVSGVRRADVDALMDTLCRRVREDPHEHPVTISIGLARVEGHDTLNQALANADKALYVSKNSGKDRFTFYAQDMGA